jgi:DNA-binding response OmpR family regulator
MKILIIDDEPAILSNLQDMLELSGHTVLAAADGLEGVRLAATHPDLILCDIGMPGMDGYQVIGAVQGLAGCADIPFIFLTARADREDQRRGMALGADDYITKPFTEREILDAIAARVRRQQPLREQVEALRAAYRREIDANWAHELMTPLNGILGGVQLIEATADSIKPAELRELLELIRVSARRQHLFAQKLVLYYELEALKSGSTPKASCDAAAAAAAGAEKAAQEEGRSGDLTVRCLPGFAAVLQAHLTPVVAELVGNAFRFSKPGSPVSVTGARDGPRYRIEIVDRGPGLTAEQRANAAAFTQFDRRRQNQQGLGLGLAIARATAEIYGGRLQLESAGPGQPGLKVILEVPGVA